MDRSRDINIIALALAGVCVSACVSDPYALSVVPNYDHFVGKRFAEVISPVAQLGFKKSLEAGDVDELAERRPDGCVTTFGVRKADGVIAYWRITPSPEQCKVRRKPLNV